MEILAFGFVCLLNSAYCWTSQHATFDYSDMSVSTPIGRRYFETYFVETNNIQIADEPDVLFRNNFEEPLVDVVFVGDGCQNFPCP